MQDIGAVVASQRVVIVRAEDILEIAHSVDAGAACVLCERRGQSDRNACGSAAITQQVYAASAVEPVIAVAAIDRICARVSGQHVVETRADKVFDSDKRIGASAAGKLCRRDRQTDSYPGRGGRIAGHVAVIAAIEDIVARAP